jgi:hypothetical protein
LRDDIFSEVCAKGYNKDVGAFTQYYGSDQLDASLLMIPLVGFLPAHDPRVRGTIEAVERELVEGGFVLRYRTVDTGDVDGLSGREGAFLACSFWLADCLGLLGRDHDARQLLDRLLGLRNDLGLLSEEYDPAAGRLVGNFPQAFSHVSLVNTASKMSGHDKPPPSHVILGLAQRALSHGKSASGRQHVAGFNAHSVLARLAESASPAESGRAAHVVKEAIGSPPRSSPTAKPTRVPHAKPAGKGAAKGAAKAAAKAPAKAGSARARPAGPSPAANRSGAKQRSAGPATRAGGVDETAKKTAKKVAKKTTKKVAKRATKRTTRGAVGSPAAR